MFYGRGTFEELIGCGAGDTDALAEYLYRIDDAGVWLLRLDEQGRQFVGAGDLVVLGAAHGGEYDAPALRFPFTLAQLVQFDRESVTGEIVSGRWRGGDGGRLTDTIPSKKARDLADALLDVMDGKPLEDVQPRLEPAEEPAAAVGASADALPVAVIFNQSIIVNQNGTPPPSADAERQPQPGIEQAAAAAEQGVRSDEPQQAVEIKTAEQRQDERLRAYEEAGGKVPAKGERWQGVEKIAKLCGITRQAMTKELKAADERRREASRAGRALTGSPIKNTGV